MELHAKCDSVTIMAKRIRATADGNERKYLMRDLNIIKKSKGYPYIVTFYGLLLPVLMGFGMELVHFTRKSFPEKIISKWL